MQTKGETLADTIDVIVVETLTLQQIQKLCSNDVYITTRQTDKYIA